MKQAKHFFFLRTSSNSEGLPTFLSVLFIVYIV